MVYPTTVWLLKNYSQRIFNVLYAYFIIGPNARSHYDTRNIGAI